MIVWEELTTCSQRLARTAELMADVPNLTNIEPSIQISEVKM
jgi:hypothetical protein